MNVNFEIYPEQFSFFSRNENGCADIPFKGKIEDDSGISHILMVKAISDTSSMILARYIEENVGSEFEFSLSVPCGYNYRISFELVRKDNEEWISYIKNFRYISVGDVFVIAGQSNAVGYGRGFYENSFDMRIHNFKLNEKWAIASHPLNDLDGYEGEIKRDSGEYSQHITMAKKIITHTGVPIAFIPCAVGGTEISRWNKNENGDLYHDMIRRVKLSGVTPKGIIWSQGSSDANSEYKSDKYYNSLKGFIADSREELDVPDLKIFIYQINRCLCASPENDLYWDKIRESQRKIACEDENVHAVSSFGAELMEDKIHNSPAGYDLIGERMASVVLNKIYGINTSANVPMAEKISVRENEITIIFNEQTFFVSDNVNNREYDFYVTDENGDMSLEEIKIYKNTVVLKTTGIPKGNIVVSGGRGANPKKELPIDMISRFPMLSFRFE